MSGGLPDQDELMEADMSRNDFFDDVEDMYVQPGNGNDNEEEELDRVVTPLPPINLRDPNVEIMDEQNSEDTRVRVNHAAVDLDIMSPLYKSFSLVNRLQYIADCCPPLQKDALVLICSTLKKNTSNVPRYVAAQNLLENLYKGDKNLLTLDTAWVESTNTRTSTRVDQLLAEFKKQKDEGVKESTRRAMEELFVHYMDMGNFSDALRLYNKGMRDHCSQYRHVMSMLMQWLECALVAEEWSRVPPLLSQAERAMSDASDAEQLANSTSAAGRPRAPAQQSGKSNKQITESCRALIDTVYGLARLHEKLYSGAAEKFLIVNPDDIPIPWLVSHSDIALYGTLCALASYDRKELKKKVLGGESPFKRFMESEPALIQLTNQFIKSQFGACFDILDRLKDRLLLDPNLAPHIPTLYDAIRERAMLQYLAPFGKADGRLMANAFRCDIVTLEDSLVSLCDKGLLSVRIDSVKKEISMPTVDQREEAYKRIMEVSENAIEKASSTILRALLGQGRVYCQLENRDRGKRRPASHQSNDEGHGHSMTTRALRRVKQAFTGSNSGSPEADSNTVDAIDSPIVIPSSVLSGLLASVPLPSLPQAQQAGHPEPAEAAEADGAQVPEPMI